VSISQKYFSMAHFSRAYFSRALLALVLASTVSVFDVRGEDASWNQVVTAPRYDVTAPDDILTSGALFRKIYGDNFVDIYKDLPVDGEAAVIPHSGHWYPTSKGGLNTTDVLVKYDRAYNGGKGLAYSWEVKHRTSKVSWHGHCNGYAASSLRHREPKNSVMVGDIEFTRKDIKALLTGLYMGVRYRMLGGKRCESDPKKALEPEERKNCDDINPSLFHLILTNWVGKQKQAIIFDRNADAQVWNFPLYGYQTQAYPVTPAEAMQALGWADTTYKINPNAARLLHVSTTVYYADAVNEEEILDHTEEAMEVYKYILELDSKGRIIGGEWALSSITSHPDFLWVPLRTKKSGPERQLANPHLDIDIVLNLWAKSRGLRSPDDEPSPYDLFDFESNWGQFSFYDVTMGHLPSGSGYAFLASRLDIDLHDHISIGRSRNLLSVSVDGKPFAKPYLVDGEKTSIILPGGEPGISTYKFLWNVPFLKSSPFVNIFAIYTME